MVIVESDIELNNFVKDYNLYDSILLPVFRDHKKPFCINELSFIFVHTFNEKDYILPFCHSDCINLDKSVLKLLDNEKIKYTFDKKEFLNFLNIKNLIDVKVLEYLHTGKVIDFSHILEIQRFYYNNFFNNENINSIISITKFVELLFIYRDKLKDMIKQYHSSINEPAFHYINNVMIDTLSEIEKNGIFVNELFSKKELIYNNYIYSSYNIFTKTSRPTCTSTGFNLTAINKKDGTRKAFSSRFENGVMLLFDYDAYHIYLLANLLEESFNENPYYFLAKQILGKTEIEADEYDKIKILVYQIIYNKITKESESIPFFKKVKQLGQILYDDLKEKQYIITPIFERKIYLDVLGITNQQKLLNYYIQAFETENNILILNKLNNIMKNYQSKIIIYTYDSILIDFNLEDGKDLVFTIKNILENEKKYPCKFLFGKDYHYMNKI
jgi:hypothetical protein